MNLILFFQPWESDSFVERRVPFGVIAVHPKESYLTRPGVHTVLGSGGIDVTTAS